MVLSTQLLRNSSQKSKRRVHRNAASRRAAIQRSISHAIACEQLEDRTLLAIPSVVIEPVTPETSANAIAEVTVNFSETVVGVDVGDFTLLRLGSEVNLTGATLTEVDGSGGSEYILDLSNATTADGDYQLTLNALGTNIASVEGDLLVDGDTESFSVVNPEAGPVLSSIGNQTIPAGENEITINVSASLLLESDELTFTAEGQSLAYVLDQQLGLETTGNTFFNWGGINEKWFQGNDDRWYFVTPLGQMFEWDGSDDATGTLVANVGVEAYADVSLIYDAEADNPPATFEVTATSDTTADVTIRTDEAFYGGFVVTVTVADEDGQTDSETFIVNKEADELNRQIDEQLDIRFKGDLFFNYGGRGEIWLRGNDPDNTWYFILPDGEMYAWNGIEGFATGTFMAQVDPSAYDNPEFLYRGQDVFFDLEFGFTFTGSFHHDWGGLDEKWLLSEDGDWYFIVPSGDMFRWDGSGSATGTFIVTLDGNTYRNPERLYNAAEETEATGSSSLLDDLFSGLLDFLL